MATKIEWCEETWSPITGCSSVSEGCEHCYARRMAQRLKGRYGYPKDDPFRVTFHPDRLNQPLKWKKPRHIFVCSMGDLFHEHVPFELVATVLKATWKVPQHIYLLLTKRPERVLEFDEWSETVGMDRGCILSPWQEFIWLGVTAENQNRLDERVGILLQIPAAKHFVSIEPMLGPVNLHLGDTQSDVVWRRIHGGNYQRVFLDWVIVGGESGPGARPIGFAPIYEVVRQCKEAGVPCFVKQTGSSLAKNQGYKNSKGADINEWPERIRVREYPDDK